MKKWMIISINILILILGIYMAVQYSTRVYAERTEMSKDAFVSTVYSMEQVTVSYLNAEQGYVNNWRQYINDSELTLDETLALLKNLNSDSDISVHILDPDTMTGFSTTPSVLDESDYSVDYSYLNSDTQTELAEIAQGGTSDGMQIVSAFSSPADGRTVVGFGNTITLVQADGLKKNYLLLRLVPVDNLQDQWVFPTGYEDAEVGLISANGDYIIRSNSMKSENFLEFLRAYNELTYPERDEILERMTKYGSGVLEYKNSKGEDSYWVYTPVNDSDKWYLIGYVPIKSLGTNANNWILVAIVAGMLGLLFLVDGFYFIYINRRLRESVIAANQANEAKTRFLSTMSHDIRTPMNAVIGMTSIAHRCIDDKSRVRDCLDKIEASGNHLLALINDILDISKVESDDFTLNPIAFSLKGTVDNLTNIIRPQAAGKDLTFDVTFDDSKPIYLYADELRLNQIFINLLSNAVKYTQAGGTISMTLAWQEVPNSSDIHLTCTVTDTGIGMSRGFIDRIFQPFTREEDGRISTIEGTGLGLAITKRLVDLMHGTITVESEQKKGSVFEVSLTLPSAKPENEPEDSTDQPLASPGTDTAADQKDAKKTKDTANDFRGMHLLIAEDNDMNYEIIESLLSFQNITCDRAENGAICVQMIHESPENYNAILMDVQMPVMNGKDAARSIRGSSNPLVKNIPIIAMTADAFAEDVQACLDAGMNAHIAKPIDMKLLLSKLQNLNNYKTET